MKSDLLRFINKKTSFIEETLMILINNLRLY